MPTENMEAPTAADPKVGRTLNRRQRKSLGLTFFNVRRKMLEVRDAGGDPADAFDVWEAMADENPNAYADPGIDWDAFLDFLERLMALIMRLFAI